MPTTSEPFHQYIRKRYTRVALHAWDHHCASCRDLMLESVSGWTRRPEGDMGWAHAAPIKASLKHTSLDKSALGLRDHAVLWFGTSSA